MLNNVKKNVFWAHPDSPPAISTQNTENLAETIQITNLRQILNFSIMMIIVQAINAGFCSLIRIRNCHLSLELLVIGLFVLAMICNIFFIDRLLEKLNPGQNVELLNFHTYVFTGIMAVFCLCMSYINLKERISMDNYLLFCLYIAACPLMSLQESLTTVILTAAAAFVLFVRQQAPPVIYSQMALFCAASVFLSQSRYYCTIDSILQLYRINEENVCLLDQADHDSLTRLLNRCGFSRKLSELLPLTVRLNIPVAVIMVDIDFFKLFNDTYGHCEGDVCLQKVADTLADSVHRDTDFVCRCGGEEFQILLYGILHEDAVRAADRLRRKVEGLNIPSVDQSVSPHITISLGLASGILSRPEDFDAMIRMADQQLYLSKETGKNKVTSCRFKSRPSILSRGPAGLEQSEPVCSATQARLTHAPAAEAAGSGDLPDIPGPRDGTQT